MKTHYLYYDIPMPPRSLYSMKKSLYVLRYCKATTVNVLYEKALSVLQYFKAITGIVLYEKCIVCSTICPGHYYSLYYMKKPCLYYDISRSSQAMYYMKKYCLYYNISRLPRSMYSMENHCLYYDISRPLSMYFMRNYYLY